MSHLVLKVLNLNNVVVKDSYSSYKLYYDETFPIKGIPFHCIGKLIDMNDHYKFYIEKSKNKDIVKLNDMLVSSLEEYNGFINKDDEGDYLYFSKNYYINDKIKNDGEGLHLNIKYINKNNYNTVIHII
uniref:Uncharacterized protein n=1 Tax=viral metagenome TaxID=1070528 RepID=A0A6C0FDL4_9ZZZZ|tara:strand:- start:3742 stop:4128 length:387 start_codon:yes stop_codon:yes gene_type:complete